MAQNLISDLAKEFISGNNSEVVDIITFVEAPWGLNIKLLPVQKFILRCYYGMPLDNTNRYLNIPDIINERILYQFTEKEFLKWLYEEGRCNTDITEGKNFHELVMVIGRRGSKCRSFEDRIATTDGSLTFAELLEKHDKGRRDIGILTYDPETLKKSITYDFKAWYSGSPECFRIETKRGIQETSSGNHPYFVWRDEWEKPRFIELANIQKGDKIAMANSIDLFGRGGIGVGKAALLGYFQGDGGTTESAGFTVAYPKRLEDFTRLIREEFPKYVVVKRGIKAFRYGYSVVKASGRFLQDGSQKNEVVEWLKDVGCFGKKSIHKEVPDCIYKASKQETVAFLSRLFACDGWASTEKKVQKGHGGVPKSHIGYCSASYKLIGGVRHLLLKFGIHCVITPFDAKCDDKVFKAWRLCITRSDSIELFQKEINIFSKEKAVESVVVAARLRSEPKSEFDSIPSGIWKYIARIMEERDLSGADVVGEHGIGVNGRLRTIYAPHQRKILSYGSNIGDKFLMDMGSSDVKWDKVESVCSVGVKHTVDLEVNGTHIIGGDLISHNSSIASFISNYELYKLLKYSDPAKHFGFPASTPIYILNVAPTDEQAGIVFDMIQNTAMNCAYMKDRSLHNTMTYFDLQTDFDLKVYGKPKASLVSMAGGCSSNSLRGRNAIIVIMDEMAHFIDNAGRFSGSEVYKALTPSVFSFHREGKIISMSSPYAKFGSFYDRFNQSFEEKEITLMFKMYSAMVNPTIPTEILAAARRRDRIGFMCEFGGEFSDSITAWIDDENEFRKCVINTPLPTTGVPDTDYFMGIDIGFKNDGTAVSIVHQDKQTKKIILDYSNVWFSGSSDVWEFPDGLYAQCKKYAGNDLLSLADIINEIKALNRLFPITAGIFDQHNGYALAELFRKENLKQFEMEQFTDMMNSDVYQLAKTLYAEQLLSVSNHRILVPEILTLEAEKRARNKVLVRAPNRRGAHDDVSDSYIRAVWLCYKNKSEKSPNIATGAGGHVGRVNTGSDGSPMQETAMLFRLRKLKAHGAHPRGLGGFNKRSGGNGMIGAMSRRLITGL